MNPRRSFVPRLDINAIAKRLSTTDSQQTEQVGQKLQEEKAQSPFQSNKKPQSEQKPQTPRVVRSSVKKPNLHELSMADIDFDLNIPLKSVAKPNHEMLKILQKPFYREDIVVNVNDSSFKSYLEVVHHIYSIQTLRMKSYYDNHPVLSAVLNDLDQEMKEYFVAEEQAKKQPKGYRKKVADNENEIRKLNAQQEQYESLTYAMHSQERMIEYKLEDLENVPIFDELHKKLNQGGISRNSVDFITKLVRSQTDLLSQMVKEFEADRDNERQNKVCKILGQFEMSDEILSETLQMTSNMYTQFARPIEVNINLLPI